MRVRVELDPNYLGVLVRSPEMKRVVDRVAEAIAAEAKRLAPLGRTDSHPYREGIKSETGVDEDGLVGRVNATYFTSHWIEFGTSHSRPFSPLRRAMESGAAKRVL